MARLACVVVLLFAVVAVVEGQSCVPYHGSPATGGKCDSIVTYPNVLLLPTKTYTQVDEEAASTTKLLGAFVPQTCRSAAIRLACMGSFIECSFSPSFVYRPPCKSACDEVIQACSAFFLAQGLTASLPNCSAPAFASPVCNNHSAGVVVPYSQADCPYPLKYNPKGSIADSSQSLMSPDQVCVYPCPAPMFTSQEWDASMGLLMALASLALVMTVFLIITYCLMPTKRRFPASFQIYLLITSAICSVGAILSVLVGGPRKTVCSWDDVPVLQTFARAGDNGGQGVACILQGALVAFGGLSGSCWWLMLTVTAFSLIVLRVPPRPMVTVFHVSSHVVGWGFPTLTTVIGLAAQKFESLSGSPNCFIAHPWDWGLWYGPVAFNLLVGTPLMLVVIFKVWRVRARLKEMNATMISAEHLIRLFILVIGFWLIGVFFVGHRIYTEIVSEDIQSAVAEQVMCSAATGEPCPLTSQFNKGSWLLQAMALGGQGIAFSVILGSSKDLFTFWPLLFRRWQTRGWGHHGGHTDEETDEL